MLWQVCVEHALALAASISLLQLHKFWQQRLGLAAAVLLDADCIAALSVLGGRTPRAELERRAVGLMFPVSHSPACLVWAERVRA